MSLPRAGLLVALVLLSACAATPSRTAQTAECREYLEAIDLRIANAGVRDAGAQRVAGYPYLRVDRFSASFRREVTDEARFRRWLELLRGLDLRARSAELANLGDEKPRQVLEAIDRCGAALAQLELADASARAHLLEATTAADEYYLPARVLGAYPLAVPLLDLGIYRFRKEVEADYATPLGDLDHPGTLVRWEATPAETVPVKEAKAWLAHNDALGIPQLSPEQWRRLAQTHAPIWWLEQNGDYDRPGAPVFGGDAVSVDADRPVTYFQPAYTRLAGKVLVQLVYTVWFAERPSKKIIDPYAGALDGIVWRVTLDAEAQPLLHDTIHPCGCYHEYFPVWPAVRKPHGGIWQERALFPQGKVTSAAPVAVRVQSATHYVRRLVEPADAKAQQVRRYELRPYAELLTLDIGDGRTRSLFGENGIVSGSERGERFWLWVSGVPDPGAMRQWGRHATAFVGRSHFDDSEFLDQLFELPANK